MKTETEMVAYALEIDPSLLPHVPELLADLDELGSDAELIVETLSALDLPDSTKVIDLGCGKGAVAQEIADELGFQVLGIDLFQPFIEGAKQSVVKNGLAQLCNFRVGNVATLAGQTEPVDVAIFAALGDVLGDWQETMSIIRQYVKTGGLILISDAYLKPGGSAAFDGFRGYQERQQTVDQLTAHGDELVQEIPEPSYDDDDEPDESELILERAQNLAQQHPKIATQLLAFAESQQEENDYIEQNLLGAIWVLRKT